MSTMTPGPVRPSPSAQGLAVQSSLPELVDGFAWAKDFALTFVQTGRPGCMPSYWAGLQDRPMFYSRDLAHQSLGAHLLGLDHENFAMFRHFAASATPRRNYYPLWAFTFDGEPAAIDYVSDDRFVRETPAPYELVEKGIEQYRWTGDSRWITDETLARYYRQTIFDFTRTHDIHGTGIAGEQSAHDIFAGSPTYDEMGTAPDIQVAADGLSSQWAATVAYADIAADPADARRARELADGLRETFARDWWNDDASHYVAGFTADRPLTQFANEATWFPAVKSMLPADRAAQHLEFLSARLRHTLPQNIEAMTYLPEAFLNYGHDEAALRWIRHLLDSRDDYPEVSFTLVAHICAGLTGIRPSEGTIRTRSHLSGSEWIRVEGVAVGGAVISLRHDGATSSELRVESGDGPVTWVAEFPDQEETTVVDVGQTARVHAARR